MILGTAGHVDHGKTSLVKALTGIDTDRLPDEKARGMTLELGFAHLDLPGGRRVGVIDVPGHERFVKAMTAGAGGIDVVLLVVAADEGVMPQTREHVDICRLLGVRRGILVVSKADVLPTLGAGWLEMVETELRAAVQGTFLEAAPLVAVSAKTGVGLDRLLSEIETALAGLETSGQRPADGPLFLPVDRAFSVKGFGCVVTGTLLSGRLTSADSVELVPSEHGALRIRGLQQHGGAVSEAMAGERVAVNLAQVETSAVRRGMALVRSGELTAVKVLDVELTLLPSVPAPLHRRSRHGVVLGTDAVEAIIRLVDVDQLKPGESCFAQLRVARPIAAVPQLRFIVRGTTSVAGRGATLGGGRVLALDGPRRRAGASVLLSALSTGEVDQRVEWLLTQAGSLGLTEQALFARASASAKALRKALDKSLAQGSAMLVDKDQRRFVSAKVMGALARRTLVTLDRLHIEQPEDDSFSREALRQIVGAPPERTWLRVVSALEQGAAVEISKESIKLPGRGRAFTEESLRALKHIDDLLESAGLEPPLVAELETKLQLSGSRLAALLQTLAKQGRVVRAGGLYFSARSVETLEHAVVQFLKANREMTTQQFKELARVSRKFLIPLAELLDARRVTLRVGSVRVLRGHAS